MRGHRLLAVAVGLSLLGAACSDGPDAVEGDDLPGQPELALEVVTDGLRSPTTMASAPGDDRLFVLEQMSGQIRVIDDGELLDEPFLDLRDRLFANGDGAGEETGERGLLSLAFHPDYADNGRFFVYYADLSGLPELLEYHVSDDPTRADPASAVVLHQFNRSQIHYGGAMQFAPDGTLWFSIGDGRDGLAAGDITELRGSILRFDVSTPGEAVGAEGNPFLGEQPGADELWAYGLRNPWRFSIDAETGLLYVGDVGAVSMEEISVAPIDEPGLDFGWPTFEGTLCRAEPDCDPAGTVVPAVELPRDVGACSVIGGEVYRGPAIPDLQGAYLFSDYCTGFLRSFRYVDGEVTEELEWFDDIGRIASFGVDASGELYLVEKPTGTIYKIVPG